MKTFNNMKLWIAVYVSAAILLVELAVFVYAIATFKLPTKKDFVLRDNSDNEIELTNTIVHKKLEAVGEIASYKYVYDGYMTRESDRGWEFLNFLTESSVEVDYTGTIKAGVNVDDIEIEVDDKDKVIYLTMPRPIIISNEIDITHYSEEVAIFGGVAGDTANSMMDIAREEELQEAINDGLMRNANENAKEIIRGLLSVYDDYEIVFNDYDEGWS